MNTEAAANPADEGPVTLADPMDAGSQDTSTEAKPDEPTLDDLTKEALGDAPATPEAEDVEVEYEGGKYKLPPALKDAFLRHQDYTHKTMDLAQQRKAFEEETATFKATAAEIQQDFQEHAKLRGLQFAIADLEKTDTSYWTDEEIQNGVARLNAMRAQAQGLNQAINARQQQRQSSAQNEREKCLKEAAARVPNFDARRAELEKLALDIGADKDDVANLSEPWAYELMHFADIGKKFIERQRKAAQMKAAHAGSPATMLGGNASSGKSPADMSMEEYSAWRSAGNG